MSDQILERELEPPEPVAAAWVARECLGALSADDRRVRDLWLASNPANRAAYDSATAAMKTASGMQFVLQRADGTQRRRATRRYTLIRRAGALAASLAIVAFYFGSDLAALVADYGTGPGQQKNILLADGTRVTLDTQSAIRVDYSSALRQVTLVRGRAFFEVVHNRDRPFAVRALGGEARDIGTAFVMSRIADRAEVLVTEGEVSLSHDGRAVTLTKGFGSRWGKVEEAARPRPFCASAALGWREGRIVVDHQPLSGVIAELNRYRRTPIILLDGEAGRRTVSGVVQADNVESSLAALAEAQGLRAISLPFATLLLAK